MLFFTFPNLINLSLFFTAITFLNFNKMKNCCKLKFS